MTVLVIGGAASGKSAYAEQLAVRLSGGLPLLYIATMEPFGPEAAARIEKHQKMRSGMGFLTLECYTGLADLSVPDGCCALLEDLGNLCANELFSPAGSGERAEESILSGIAHLRSRCRHLLMVSNELFTDGNDYQGDTDRYLRLLSSIHRKLAESADGVCEIVCGIPLYYKGAEPDVDT